MNKETIIGIIGSGAMGSGIAQVAATAGHQVILFDVDLNLLAESENKFKTNICWRPIFIFSKTFSITCD